MARASILWLTGEYCEHVPKISPDLLRKVAKTFTNEEDIVKMQAVNLASKLYLTNSRQVTQILKYTNLCHKIKLCLFAYEYTFLKLSDPKKIHYLKDIFS